MTQLLPIHGGGGVEGAGGAEPFKTPPHLWGVAPKAPEGLSRLKLLPIHGEGAPKAPEGLSRSKLLPIYGEVAPKAPEGLSRLKLLPIYGEVAPQAPEGLSEPPAKPPDTSRTA